MTLQNLSDNIAAHLMTHTHHDRLHYDNGPLCPKPQGSNNSHKQKTLKPQQVATPSSEINEWDCPNSWQTLRNVTTLFCMCQNFYPSNLNFKALKMGFKFHGQCTQNFVCTNGQRPETRSAKIKICNKKCLNNEMWLCVFLLAVIFGAESLKC